MRQSVLFILSPVLIFLIIMLTGQAVDISGDPLPLMYQDREQFTMSMRQGNAGYLIQPHETNERYLAYAVQRDINRACGPLF